MRTSLIATAIVAAIASVANASGPLPAPIACDDPSLPNPVYIQCGDTQQNLMLNLGRALRANSTPITLIWITAPSCNNIDLMYTNGKIGDGSTAGGSETALGYVPSVAQDATWTPSDGTASCNLPVGGVAPDVGNSALYNSACTAAPAQPANVYLAGSPASQTGQNQTGGLGPKQAYVLAVPRGTSVNAITAEEAYFLFGFGPTILAAMSAAIDPWTDEMQLFIRKNGTSTLLAWGANLGIPATAFHGVQEGSSQIVVTALTGANDAQAIGMIGAEVYDTLRAQLQTLAFRAFGQYAAYFPDSTATSRDKKNLRDGHYTVWSPTVWMDHTDGVATATYPQGTPLNQNARYVIDIINNQDPTPTGIPAPSFDTQAVVASVGLVPDCAMRVQRSFEGAPLSLYTPLAPPNGPGSCTCKFEATVDVTSCATCDDSTPCATGVCRAGYCEEF